MPARGLDLLQVVAHLGRRVGPQREQRHAHDGIHRRADLVRHIGQEGALGFAGGFGSQPACPLAQALDAEGHVVRQLQQQLDLLGREGIGLAGVDHHGAESAGVRQHHRQGDAGLVAMPERDVAPGRHLGIAQVVLVDLWLAAADGCAGRSAAQFRVRVPADLDVGQVTVVRTPGHQWPDRLAGVLFGTADPGHAVAAGLDHDAADVAQQFGLGVGAGQREVAVAQQAQRALHLVFGLLGFDAARDVARHAEQADDPAVLVADRVFAVVDPAGPAVLAHDGLDLVRDRQAGKDLLFQVVVAVGQGFRKDVVVGLAQQVGPVLGRTADRHQGLAGAGEDMVAVLEVDEVVGVLHHGPEVGRQRCIIQRPRQALGVLQLQLQHDFAVPRRRSDVARPDAADPAAGLTQPQAQGTG